MYNNEAKVLLIIQSFAIKQHSAWNKLASVDKFDLTMLQKY